MIKLEYLISLLQFKPDELINIVHDQIIKEPFIYKNLIVDTVEKEFDDLDFYKRHVTSESFKNGKPKPDFQTLKGILGNILKRVNVL